MSGLQLDHVSIAVPRFDSALERWRQLGFRVTVTPAAAQRHSRLHLDRTYLEIAQPIDAAPSQWEARLFFFRFEDRDATRARLLERGVATRPREYRGVDGTWEELELQSPELPLPVLVRRTEPVDVARDWPPALVEPHPNGAVTLEGVALESTRPEELTAVFTALLDDAGTRTRAASVEILPGRANLVAGIRFGVSNLEMTAGFLRSSGVAFEAARKRLVVARQETGAVQLELVPRS